ncbi:L-glutamate gamma-semialdehyde dehydrogenase [Candidatus Fermentibacteria bacterium]|nr:L-glutamate gamma-semialdehyde dehydrogenase [Candidatus Fermentibacteria bacterium]
MHNSIVRLERPENEPVMSYAPGSPERERIASRLEELKDDQIEIPTIIGGKEVRTGDLAECRCPHDHGTILGRYHKAGPEQVDQAVEASQKAWREWSEMHWQARASIFGRMADLLAGKYRMTLNAATMLCQSKTIHQAEIDSACELIDFYRFNPFYMTQIYGEQPASARGVWNYLEYRPLEGFVFAVTPFNFTSIAGNLPTSAALMGNTVLWKPASSAVYPAYFLMELFKEAGLPDGVINFLPGRGSALGDPIMGQEELAGVHFTGSTAVFRRMWKTVGENIADYKSYPRIVGETGGKDFAFVHPSADPKTVVANLVRGAYEYQGQKCSAASRAYVPESLWPEVSESMVEDIKTLRMGDISDLGMFMGALIDEAAFESVTSYVELAKESDDAEILTGGGYDKSEGYFVEPTLVRSDDPGHRLMREEIFGPVLTVYVYPDGQYEDILHLCDRTSIYGLTGSIFARDRAAVQMAYRILRHSAGNFYVNDKPTGAVVGQQPFGGSRGSGTNDKAGSHINLLRWVSARTVKENLNPVTDFRYPYMGE